eukprot:COSAG04_NODE_13296_length_612_cov_1.058480_1_plen_35_part_10
MMAGGQGRLPLMRILLEAKADIKVVDNDGWTAFHI